MQLLLLTHQPPNCIELWFLRPIVRAKIEEAFTDSQTLCLIIHTIDQGPGNDFLTGGAELS